MEGSHRNKANLEQKKKKLARESRLMMMAQTKQLAPERPEVKTPKVAVASSWQSFHLIGLSAKVLLCLQTSLPQKSKITLFLFSFNVWCMLYVCAA